MSQLTKSNFETKYNDGTSGLYKTGQTEGIGSDDHRALVTDIKDSFLNKSDEWVDVSEVDTTGATITLDMDTRRMRSFYGSDVVDGNRTISFDNAGVALVVPSFRFEVDDLHVFTFPGNTKMSDALWDSSAKTWTPMDIGEYEMQATYDALSPTGTWFVKIFGPFN